jgi:hypothetical protein
MAFTMRVAPGHNTERSARDTGANQCHFSNFGHGYLWRIQVPLSIAPARCMRQNDISQFQVGATADLRLIGPGKELNGFFRSLAFAGPWVGSTCAAVFGFFSILASWQKSTRLSGSLDLWVRSLAGAVRTEDVTQSVERVSGVGVRCAC